MSRPVLVAYASKHGSTAEVAEVIAASLCQLGLEVEVSPVSDVDEASRCRGVVLGGALYMGAFIATRGGSSAGIVRRSRRCRSQCSR